MYSLHLKQNDEAEYQGGRKPQTTSLHWLTLMQTHPFVEERHKAIAFRFSCSHIFDNTSISVDKRTEVNTPQMAEHHKHKRVLKDFVNKNLFRQITGEKKQVKGRQKT